MMNVTAQTNFFALKLLFVCIYIFYLICVFYPVSLKLAMSGKSAKRLRTLASKLLGEDDDDCALQVSKVNQTWHSHSMGPRSLEIEGLQLKVLNLESQRVALETTLGRLREKLSQVTLQLYEAQKFVVPLCGEPGASSQPWSPNTWMTDNPDLLQLPCMEEFLLQWEMCNCKSEISFRLCKQQCMTASRILKHCEWVVVNLSRKHPAVYKIGITENVIDRWKGKSYSYKFDPYDDWQHMTVVFVGADSLQCGFVESYLIHRFLGRSGCRNLRPGGESAKAGSGPFFTYVVWKSLAPPGK